MNLIQLGNFILSSGKTSSWKLECDDFIKENIDGLVELIRQVAGPFSVVVGVPRGGLLLAEALRPWTKKGAPYLVVDDVLTTGKSMRDFILQFTAFCPTPYPVVNGVVVFSRGPCPFGVTPLFQMPYELWGRENERTPPLS